MVEFKKCFVLMPFDESFREVYTDVYKAVCTEHHIDCWRVDEISRPGSITRDIVEGILDADIVIADLTSKNPNVFYELGIAHSVGNKTIMTAQSINDVPFDVANYRVILYQQSIAGARELKRKLGEAIRELLKALDQTNNPLQEAMSRRSALGKHRKTPLVKYVDVNSLPKRMRDWLQENGISYAEDVNNIDLEALANTEGLGQTSLGKFLSQVLQHDLYDDAEKLQAVVLKHGIKLRDFHGNWY
jgi:hypothetical protein